MASVQAVAGGHMGYVRAVFSARCRGFALPVDLVRANLRAVARVSVRRRVAAEFAGYLVTDVGPDVVPMFSPGRGAYQCGQDRAGMTAVRGAWGAIDAPDYVPAGGCMNLGPFWWPGESSQMLSPRGGLLPSAEAVPAAVPVFACQRWFHSFDSLAKTGVDMAAPRSWQPWVVYEVVGALDAPEDIAAGGVGVLTVMDSGRRLTKTNYVKRGGE